MSSVQGENFIENLENQETAKGQPSAGALLEATPENEGALNRGHLKRRTAGTPALPRLPVAPGTTSPERQRVSRGRSPTDAVHGLVATPPPQISLNNSASVPPTNPRLEKPI